MRCHLGALRRSWQVVHAATLVLGLAACSRPGGNSPFSGDDDDDGGSNQEGYLEPGTGVLDVPITLEESLGVARHGEPVRSGIPVPRGLDLKDATRIVVLDENGDELATQVLVTSRWGGAPDDESLPIKWVLVDFQADVEANATEIHRIRTRAAAAPAGAGIAQESGDTIVVDTGAAKVTLSRSKFDLFSDVTLADGTKIAGANGGIVLTKTGGTKFLASAGTTEVAIEENGPVRAVVVARGKHRDANGVALLDWTARVHFFAGRSEAQVSYTFTERDLPSIRSYVSVDEASITLPAIVGDAPRFTFGGTQSVHTGTIAGEAFLRQTGKLSPVMASQFNPGNADSITYALGGSASGGGGHAPGWVDLSGSKGGVTAAVRWFWEQYPKKLAVRPDAVDVVLWPREEADMRVYAAAQKTHDVLFAFHGPDDDVAARGREAAARLANPLFARCDPSWYARSWVWNKIGTANADDYAPEHRDMVERYFDNLMGVEYPSTFRDRKYDGKGLGHSYSVWDFGDGREHYWSNLAYDTPRSLFMHWAITGDRALLDDGFAAAAHLRDVDIEHSPLDTRAGITGHRGVSKPWLGRTRYNPSEGPQSHDLGFEGRTGYAFEHHKGQSLADHWFLTGDRMSKEVLAETYHYFEQWKVDADSGYLRGDGTRVLSHMLLVLLGYHDAYGTPESRDRIEYVVRYLDEWQRLKSAKDPAGLMWTTDGDTTSTFMNAVTAESLMLYETAFPDGRPVRQCLVDAASWTIDTKNGQLVNGSLGHYFNAWTGHNYGVPHATVLDAMVGPMLAYAGDATGEAEYTDLAKEVMVNQIQQDTSTGYMKAFTQQTRLVPAFLYYLQTDEARREGSAQ